MRRALAAALILFLVLMLGGPAVAQAPGGSGGAGAIELFVDGTAVTPEAPPFIDGNHRVQVPLRVVGEALGGRVTWIPDGRRVAVDLEGLLVEMTVGHRVCLVNGEPRLMDTVPVLKDGRAFVPVRFLGEALQCRVEWDGRRVLIWAGTQARLPAPAPQPERLHTAPEPPLPGFEPGAPAAAVVQAWGAPVREDPGRYGFEWWVYHRDYHDYRLLGVRDGQVAVFYTNAPERGPWGVGVGDLRADVERVFRITKTFQFKYQGAEFTVEQPTGQMTAAPWSVDGDQLVQFFFDVHRDHRLTAFRTMDIPAFLAMQPGTFTIMCRYWGRMPDFGPPEVSATQLEQVNRAEERQLFDLTNALRQREGLDLFRWDERVAGAARSHSEDMLQHDYFSHQSPTRGSPGDRLTRHGVRWRGYAENIALCPDAVTAHEALMDSPGHRANILSDSFPHLGVGVADRYYTQNFVRY